MYKKETIRIHKAWKEVKRYVKKWTKNELGDRLYYKGTAKNIYHKIEEFKKLYYSTKGTGNIVQTIKSNLRYKTALKTARALKQSGAFVTHGKTKKGTPRKRALEFVKSEISGTSLKDLRMMNTHDIVKENPKLGKEIKEMYHELRAKGLNSTEASKEIASFYFGS